MRLSALVTRWHDFWFLPASPVPIALFRIVIGFLSFVLGASYIPNLQMWFGEKGIVSLKSSLENAAPGQINLFVFLPSGEEWIVAFIALFMLVAFFLMIGLFARFSAVAVHLGIASLFARCPGICNGGEGLLWVLTFFLIFCPVGAAISVDRLLRRMRGKESGPPPQHPRWGQRLIQLYVAFFYFSCFYWKAQGPLWIDGTAVYYSVRQEHLWRFSMPYLYDHMWTMRLLTWYTLAVEGLFPFLIWIREVRYGMMAAAILLHLGIEYSFNLLLFQWVAMASYLTFVEPEDLQRLMGRVRSWIASFKVSAASLLSDR